MILLLPLTNGAMKQHTVSLLKYVSYEVAFIDKSSFSKNELKQYSDKVRFIDKREGLKKLLWSISVIQAYKFIKLAKNLKQNKILIANGEFIPHFFFLSFIARLRGIEIITCWHDVTPHVGRFSNYLYWLSSFFNTLISNRVITHSKHYLKILQKLPLYKNKTYFVPLPPYGFDTKNIFTRGGFSTSIVGKKEYYVFLGRLERYKGVHNLTKVFSKLNDKILIISGTGETNYIRSLIFQAGSSANIFLNEEYISENDFLDLLSNSKALILPYIHASQSALPYIAASLSVPIITTIGTGISDLVEELKGYSYVSDKELLSILTKSNLRPTVYDQKAHLAEFKVLMNEVIKLV